MLVVQKDKRTQEIVKGILNNDNKTIVMIYQTYFNSIRKLVSGFRNLKLDAEDVFQEGLSRAIVNIKHNKFKGESTFHSYFYAICRNICLKEVKKTNHDTNLVYDPVEPESENKEWDLIQLILELRNTMEPQCKEIIDLRFNIERTYEGKERLTPFDFIAAKLKIKVENARQIFHRCMKKFTSMCMSNPSYKEIISSQ